MPEPKWSGRNPSQSGDGGSSTLSGLTDVTGAPSPGTAPVYDDTGVAPLTPITTQQDLDQVLEQVATVERHHIGQPGEPPFLSGFRNIGDPWAPACYRHLANSTVRLEGTVMCQDQTIQDATWIPIFTLPAELAPEANLEFAVLTNDDAISKVLVWADGQVIWGGYTPLGPKGSVDRLPLNQLSWSTT